MSDRGYFVAGNWKMHGSLSRAASLAADVAGRAPQAVDIAVCPSYVHLAAAGQALQGSAVGLGAQDASASGEQGAFTGQVSASMLVELGCEYVILGHSERRGLLAESDDTVAKKVECAQAAGLTPIICVGETLAQREDAQTETVVITQLSAVIERCGVAALKSALLAYEPVWAIGTGLVPTTEEIGNVHGFIRAELASRFGAETADAIRILYGGSVKPGNAAEIFATNDVDGALVGGASLKADDFNGIITALGAA